MNPGTACLRWIVCHRPPVLLLVPCSAAITRATCYCCARLRPRLQSSLRESSEKRWSWLKRRKCLSCLRDGNFLTDDSVRGIEDDDVGGREKRGSAVI